MYDKACYDQMISIWPSPVRWRFSTIDAPRVSSSMIIQRVDDGIGIDVVTLIASYCSRGIAPTQ